MVRFMGVPAATALAASEAADKGGMINVGVGARFLSTSDAWLGAGASVGTVGIGGLAVAAAAGVVASAVVRVVVVMVVVVVVVDEEVVAAAGVDEVCSGFHPWAINVDMCERGFDGLL